MKLSEVGKKGPSQTKQGHLEKLTVTSICNDKI